MKVRVGTYNIHSAIGTDRRYDPQRIARVLGRMGADIIGLQEVSHRPDLLGIADQFQYFEDVTGFFGVRGPNVVLRDHHYGNALLSRWPVQAVRLIDLAVKGYEPRGAIDADLSVAGRPLRVVVTHLGLRRRERARQAAMLHEALGMVPRPGVPTLLMGDFNAWWPHGRWLRRMGDGSGRRWRPATFPTRLPLLSLDRILVTPHHLLRTLEVHRCADSRRASDHLPLVAEVFLETPDQPAPPPERTMNEPACLPRERRHGHA